MTATGLWSITSGQEQAQGRSCIYDTNMPAIGLWSITSA